MFRNLGGLSRLFLLLHYNEASLFVRNFRKVVKLYGIELLHLNYLHSGVYIYNMGKEFYDSIPFPCNSQNESVLVHRLCGVNDSPAVLTIAARIDASGIFQSTQNL